MGGTPLPPFMDFCFQQKGGYGFGGYPHPPFTDKIRKIVFDGLPNCRWIFYNVYDTWIVFECKSWWIWSNSLCSQLLYTVHILSQFTPKDILSSTSQHLAMFCTGSRISHLYMYLPVIERWESDDSHSMATGAPNISNFFHADIYSKAWTFYNICYKTNEGSIIFSVFWYLRLCILYLAWFLVVFWMVFRNLIRCIWYLWWCI